MGTTAKTSNAKVIENDMEMLQLADLNFEVSNDALSNIPLPNYCTNVTEILSGSVFTTVLLTSCKK